MGHGASTVPSVLHKHAEAEFLRVQARKRDHLVLEELLLLKAFPGIPLDFASLGVLFCMDARARGIVSLHELVAFTRFCDAQRRLCGPHQFKRWLEGQCMLKMWEELTLHGRERLEDWLLKLICQNAPLHQFGAYGDVLYVHRDSLIPFFKCLRPHVVADLEFPEFFDMLQQAGEETGLLDVREPTLDDVVPLPVVADFVHSLVDGLAGVLEDLGLADQLPAARRRQAALPTVPERAPSPG